MQPKGEHFRLENVVFRQSVDSFSFAINDERLNVFKGLLLRNHYNILAYLEKEKPTHIA
jgi:hypothetical protein